jgi:hypothetical protein
VEDVCYNCVSNCPGVSFCKPNGYKYYKRYENNAVNYKKSKEDKPQTISITAIIKDGGYEKLQITPKMLAELAVSIQEKGSEYVRLKDRYVIVVGMLVTGNEVGERVILCGDYK